MVFNQFRIKRIRNKLGAEVGGREKESCQRDLRNLGLERLEVKRIRRVIELEVLRLDLKNLNKERLRTKGLER